MMEIKDVLGAILSDLASARNISDLHSRRLVNYYRNDSLLKYFPVPRAEIKSVNIEMKFAVKLVQEDENRTSTRKGKISNVVEKYAFELVNSIADAIIMVSSDDQSLEYIAGSLSSADERMDLVQQIVDQTLQNLGNEKMESGMGHQQFIAIVIGSFKKRWPEEFALKLKTGKTGSQETTLEKVVGELLQAPSMMVMDEIAKVVKTPNDLRVELIFEAEKLQELSPAAISTVSIVSEIRNYNWHKVGDKENKPDLRLLPE